MFFFAAQQSGGNDFNGILLNQFVGRGYCVKRRRNKSHYCLDQQSIFVLLYDQKYVVSFSTDEHLLVEAQLNQLHHSGAA